MKSYTSLADSFKISIKFEFVVKTQQSIIRREDPRIFNFIGTIKI